MNQQELIAAVATQLETTKVQAKVIIETVFGVIVDEVVAGNEVRVSNVGVFSSADTAAREGRNPQTGEPLSIPASKKPTFKYSSVVKDKVKATV